MRRSILILLLATAALVVWFFWRPAGARHPAAAPATPEPAEHVAAPPAPAPLLAYRHVETRLPVGHGLCGTEIERPAPGAAPRHVPDELRALGREVPTAAAVTAAVQEWGITLPDGLDLEGRLAGAEQVRKELEADLASAVGGDDDGPADRMRTLRDLGRPREALTLAQQEHARAPTADTAMAVASLLDDTSQPDAARRMLESELPRASDSNRDWIQAQLGFLCATRGDLQCARQTVQALETSSGHEDLAAFTRGVERTFAGRLDEARSAYLAALDRSEDFATLNNLAEVDGCLGLNDKARERWIQALDHGDGPERQASALAGLALADLRAGDAAPAWIMASAAVAAGGSGTHGTDARMALSLAALTMGDLDEARAQVALARAGDPDDDLQRRRCFAHPAESASLRALGAEARGDLDGARDAWVEVARSGHAALAATARQALGKLCP